MAKLALVPVRIVAPRRTPMRLSILIVHPLRNPVGTKQDAADGFAVVILLNSLGYFSRLVARDSNHQATKFSVNGLPVRDSVALTVKFTIPARNYQYVDFGILLPPIDLLCLLPCRYRSNGAEQPVVSCIAALLLGSIERCREDKDGQGGGHWIKRA